MGPMMMKDAQERIASWPVVYADVKVPLAYESKAGKEEPAEIMIRMSGDVRLCYLYGK